VGTAVVLAREGLIPRTGSVVLEEGVGPVTVEVDVSDARAFARLNRDTQVRIPDERPARETAAAALSLPVNAVREAWYASAGVPFACIHLADSGAVDRSVLDQPAWSAGFSDGFGRSLYLFAGELAPGSTLYARMFAPDMGIAEDPATGVAAVALAGSLAELLPEREGTFTWRIDQGVKMGRPSRIEASALKRDGRAVRVMAGGAAVGVAEGTITVKEGL
jgi:trans-2,3-dihydro-3-hydroxyanthranilate isomerase